jgi:hypothetical protein
LAEFAKQPGSKSVELWDIVGSISVNHLLLVESTAFLLLSAELDHHPKPSQTTCKKPLNHVPFVVLSAETFSTTCWSAWAHDWILDSQRWGQLRLLLFDRATVFSMDWRRLGLTGYYLAARAACCTVMEDA